MPHVASAHSFSCHCEDLRTPLELRMANGYQEAGFSNNFNRSNRVRSHYGTSPYPRPQNVWIRASDLDHNENFLDLYLKVKVKFFFFVRIIDHLLGLYFSSEEGFPEEAGEDHLEPSIWLPLD